MEVPDGPTDCRQADEEQHQRCRDERQLTAGEDAATDLQPGEPGEQGQAQGRAGEQK